MDLHITGFLVHQSECMCMLTNACRILICCSATGLAKILPTQTASHTTASVEKFPNTTFLLSVALRFDYDFYSNFIFTFIRARNNIESINNLPHGHVHPDFICTYRYQRMMTRQPTRFCILLNGILSFIGSSTRNKVSH